VDRPQPYAQQRRGDALGGQHGDSAGHRGRGDLIIAIGKRGASGQAAPGQVEVLRLVEAACFDSTEPTATFSSPPSPDTTVRAPQQRDDEQAASAEAVGECERQPASTVPNLAAS
jgi:hypothetical protein